MIRYIKSDQKWNYIKKHLRSEEIDLWTVICDETIDLNINWFTEYWSQLSFNELMCGLASRFTVEQAREFLAKQIPVRLLVENIGLIAFSYTCGNPHNRAKDYVKGIKLPLTVAQLPTLDNSTLYAILKLRDNDNFDDKIVQKAAKLLAERQGAETEIIIEKGDSECKTLEPRGLKNIVQKKLTSLYSRMRLFVTQLINGMS